jgi:hypothetical protein
VRGRNSDNKLYEKMVGSKVEFPLRQGMVSTFKWIDVQVHKSPQ